MTPSDHEQLLERMVRVPERIQRLIADESNEDLCRAGVGGSWGAVEHIAHLKDFDEVTIDRVEQMLLHDNPEIDDFDTDVRAIERDYHAEDPRASVVEYENLRVMLINRLANLTDEEWRRTARHPDLGEVTVESLVQRLDEHDAEHVRAIKDVLV